jgi:hypothetical protein
MKQNKTIPKSSISFRSPKEYFENISGPTLPHRKRRCEDCAIDMYEEISVELEKMERSLIERRVESWYCHSTKTHACKGALERFGICS